MVDANVLPSTTPPICDTRVLPIKTKGRYEDALVCQECAKSIAYRLAPRLSVGSAAQVTISSQLILASTTYPLQSPHGSTL